MNLVTLVWLVLIYLVPVVLAALWLSGNPARRTWQVVAVLTLIPLFYVLYFLLLEHLQGWPTRSSLPDDFQLLAHRVNEPNPKTGDRGEIIIWLQAQGSQRPRAHLMPYDAELHRRLNDASARLADGRPQRGEHSPEEGLSGSGVMGDTDSERGHLVFRDDVDHRLPPKPVKPETADALEAGRLESPIGSP